jgi:hypothetical protein
MASVKKGARITGATRDRLAADLKKKYEKGASIRSLAEATGRSYGFVRRVLSEAGVPLRASARTLPTKQDSRVTARRLLDQVAPDRLDEAVKLLRGLLAEPSESRPRRTFRSLGVGHADHDLAAKAKEIVRQELGGGKKSA